MHNIKLFSYGVNPTLGLMSGESTIPYSSLSKHDLTVICNNERYSRGYPGINVPIVLYKALCEFSMSMRQHGVDGVHVIMSPASKAFESTLYISAIVHDQTAAMLLKLTGGEAWSIHFADITMNELPHAYDK